MSKTNTLSDFDRATLTNFVVQHHPEGWRSDWLLNVSDDTLRKLHREAKQAERANKLDTFLESMDIAPAPKCFTRPTRSYKALCAYLNKMGSTHNRDAHYFIRFSDPRSIPKLMPCYGDPALLQQWRGDPSIQVSIVGGIHSYTHQQASRIVVEASKAALAK